MKNKEQLNKHCEIIRQSRRIKNKVVILCEGDIQTVQGRESPQSYRQLEKMPDANFYRACIPKGWRQPVFFVCGDKKDVLDTYFTLLQQHSRPREDSYLNPDKLFAIVDLDIQAQKTEPSYPFSDTEVIFQNLYHRAKVNKNKAPQHRIWVTGFIHKEAYFLEPALQSVFDYFPIPLNFNQALLQLENIYLAMSDAIENDADLKNNFAKACNRINYCAALDCSELDKLKNSWKTQFQSTTDKIQKYELICALLMIKKAKDYWHQIYPEQDKWTGSIDALKDQLILAIGHFYSKEGEKQDTEYHIPLFFKTLRALL